MTSPPSFKWSFPSDLQLKPQNIEDVWKKINSNELLRKIPSRISTNVVFSDDEESDSEVENVVRKLSLDSSASEQSPSDSESNAEDCESKVKTFRPEVTDERNVYKNACATNEGTHRSAAVLKPRENEQQVAEHHDSAALRKKPLVEKSKSLDYNQVYADIFARIVQYKEKQNSKSRASCSNIDKSDLSSKQSIDRSEEGYKQSIERPEAGYKQGMDRAEAGCKQSVDGSEPAYKKYVDRPVAGCRRKSEIPRMPQPLKIIKPPDGKAGSAKDQRLLNVSKEEKDDIVVINGRTYVIISLLGSGGSCKVYSAMEKVASQQKSIIAIKHVNLKEADDVLKNSFIKEIEYLKMFRTSDYVIKLLDYEFRQREIFIILEKGDTDLANYLNDERKRENLTPITIKFLWHQMLKAVEQIHAYGIIHSDLKPANFVLVSGHLKLIDFGIATSVPSDMTSVLRDTQIGTVNYMSPETIQCHTVVDDGRRYKVGVKSDVWSLGCILYNMVYGSTPFANKHQLFAKIQAITNPDYAIPFPPLKNKHLVDVLKKCLVRNPKERASVSDLLQHPYLLEDSDLNTACNSSGDIGNIISQLQQLTPTRRDMISKVIDKLTQKKTPY